MATSVADADRMARRTGELGARLGVHLPRRFSGVAEAVHHLEERHGLGPAVAVTVEGGARCLVTNGIHWLDLVCALYGALPTSVVSDARGEPLNPRGADLRYFGGTAIWSFPGDRP
jgi:predicted dehydrogenase